MGEAAGPETPREVVDFLRYIGGLDPARRDALIGQVQTLRDGRARAVPEKAIPALVTAAVVGVCAVLAQVAFFGFKWPAGTDPDKQREAVFDVINNIELLIPAIVTAILAWLTFTLIRLTLDAIDVAREESVVSRGTLAEVQKQTGTAATQAAAATKQAETAAASLAEMTQQRLDAKARDAVKHAPFVDLSVANVVPLERVSFRGDFSSKGVPYKTTPTQPNRGDAPDILRSLVEADEYLMTSRLLVSFKVKNVGMGPALKLRANAELLPYLECGIQPYDAQSRDDASILARVLFPAMPDESMLRPDSDFSPPFPFFSVNRDFWTMLPSGGEESIEIDIRPAWRLGGDDVNAVRSLNRRHLGKKTKPPLAVRFTLTYASLDGGEVKTVFTAFIRETAILGSESILHVGVKCFESSSTDATIVIEPPVTGSPKSHDDQREITRYWDQFFESRDEERRILRRAYSLIADLPTEITSGYYLGVSDEIAEALIALPEDAAPIDIAWALRMDPLLFRIVEDDQGIEKMMDNIGDDLRAALRGYEPRAVVISRLQEDEARYASYQEEEAAQAQVVDHSVNTEAAQGSPPSDTPASE